MSNHNYNVSIALDDLCSMKTSVDCLPFVRKYCDKLRNRNFDLVKECEVQAIEINKLRTAAIKDNQRLKELNDAVLEKTERLKEWEMAADAIKPIEAAYDYLNWHETPFETDDVEKACRIIRGLLAIKEQKPETATAQTNTDSTKKEELPI